MYKLMRYFESADGARSHKCVWMRSENKQSLMDALASKAQQENAGWCGAEAVSEELSNGIAEYYITEEV